MILDLISYYMIYMLSKFDLKKKCSIFCTEEKNGNIQFAVHTLSFEQLFGHFFFGFYNFFFTLKEVHSESSGSEKNIIDLGPR